MTFYFNNKKKDFDISSTRPQESLAALFLGLAAARDIHLSFKHNWNVQANLSIVQMNVSSKVNDEWDKFTGFSPGVRLNYVRRFGKGRFSLQYGNPTMLYNSLHLHFGLAPIFMSDKQGNGLNIDFGIGYRMVFRNIKEYQMKKGKEIFR